MELRKAEVRVARGADRQAGKSSAAGNDRGGSDKLAAAAYLAQIIGDLAAISRRNEFESLTFILDMARLEAESTVQRFQT